MPPREPRGLFFQREYFSDAEFQTTLTPADREFYMGLCQMADDAGWLDWNRANIAGHLNRYQQRTGEDIDKTVEALKDTKRVRVYACGHAQLLRWGDRRHIGRPDAGSVSVRDAHLAEPGKKLPGNNREVSGKRRHVTVTPTLPNTTLPNTTLPRAGARARGGAPQSLKESLGSFEDMLAKGRNGGATRDLLSDDDVRQH